LPRQARLDAPGPLHHVTGRTINGKRYYATDAGAARFPGINTSAVNRLSVSDELPEVEKYV